ncbi:gamma-butyrobetaine hydroxylase-like domain-containing protein [Chromobacterium vaccinii]|uniref:gamma-butyrobetaine hydroxylase-like domain-containing protein n=1 Tax=Chromobacterium vaccinii TaxID=1108595 RepID=UPI001E5FE20E|nr:DUF971 domain-containing protein [Chromobacterium vaccinii]MCD4500609.1 DUF971 domain-containing protein [Chromobacterium vaccinii]
MSGLAPDAAQPVEIQLHQLSKILEIAFDDGARFELPCEYLRVHSPSAEVRGHGIGQETLQTGKMHVGITALEPVGHYALKITFDDGHDSGLYSWTYLYELGAKRGQYWQQYLDKLAAAGASRE